MKRVPTILSLLSLCLVSAALTAQKLAKHSVLNANSAKPANYNTLFQYGIADAFVGGIYRGELPISRLRTEGDFGLGAPDQIDGELTVYKGTVYQTKATGQTIVAPDSLTTSLAFVTFFHADTLFHLSQALSGKEAYQQIGKFLADKNGIYAIRISGLFGHVRTRAFPPVQNEPSPVLSTILDRQHFFDYNQVKGVLIGYKMPSYLSSINIEGFHFHFLSDDLAGGGHVVDFSAADITIEIGEIRQLTVELPHSKQFMDFNFKGSNSPELEKVEKGH